MTDNVIQFGKPKRPEQSKPVQGDMTGYQTARAISHHFGIAISNEDAIKLDRALRATVYHAMERARAEEREACAQTCERMGFDPEIESMCATAIRARGSQ